MQHSNRIEALAARPDATVPDLPPIGRPATSALHLVGITTMSQVAHHTRTELAALHGVGPKALRMLDEALGERGLGWMARSEGSG